MARLDQISAYSTMETYFEAELQRLGGAKPRRPIPMRLICPGVLSDGVTPCAALHLDEGEWTTKPHHTHSCQRCGMTWRPAVEHTVGVQFLPGFNNERAEKDSK